jgi:hypothetical protein
VICQCWNTGNLGGVPTVLELREEIRPTSDWPRPFSYERACSMARTLKHRLTESRIANAIILKGGNYKDHGRAASRSD